MFTGKEKERVVQRSQVLGMILQAARFPKTFMQWFIRFIWRHFPVEAPIDNAPANAEEHEGAEYEEAPTV